MLARAFPSPVLENCIGRRISLFFTPSDPFRSFPFLFRLVGSFSGLLGPSNFEICPLLVARSRFELMLAEEDRVNREVGVSIELLLTWRPSFLKFFPSKQAENPKLFIDLL